MARQNKETKYIRVTSPLHVYSLIYTYIDEVSPNNWSPNDMVSLKQPLTNFSQINHFFIVNLMLNKQWNIYSKGVFMINIISLLTV